MNRLLLMTVIVLVLACATAGLAFADNGPHGGYTDTTDACAGCHRAHTAVGPFLLNATSTLDLCESCHGVTAAGADTDVMSGIYDGLGPGAHDEGTVGRGLKAGGFDNALMNTDLAGASSQPATSGHVYDGSAGTAWGNGNFGTGAGPDIDLDCANCHNPHGQAGTGGSATYRILRPIPYGSGAAPGSAVDVADVVAKTYTVADAGNQYFGEDYGVAAGSLGDQLSNWCAQCHTRYDAPSGSGHTDSTDPIFAYRHATEVVEGGCGECHSGGIPPGGDFDHDPAWCVTCHVTHGTSAAMGAYSGSVPWPDGTTAPSGDNRSSLLRVDNRGVCQLCHQK